MKISLKNPHFHVEISNFGAEIESITFKNVQFLYQKQENFWQRQSPVLFPIVGALKNNSYIYNGKNFFLTQHGFARDTLFICRKFSDTKAIFEISNTPETEEKFPFSFSLQILYEITQYELKVQYIVTNTGNTPLPYSIGGHPAFKIGANIEDYYLLFEQKGNFPVYRLENGILKNSPEKHYSGGEKIPLSEEMFHNDAMIFRDIGEGTLKWQKKDQKILEIRRKNMPHLGIWKQKNSPFLCIEPWAGYADTEEHDGNILKKPGIQILTPQKNNTHEWSIVFPK